MNLARREVCFPYSGGSMTSAMGEPLRSISITTGFPEVRRVRLFPWASRQSPMALKSSLIPFTERKMSFSLKPTLSSKLPRWIPKIFNEPSS